MSPPLESREHTRIVVTGYTATVRLYDERLTIAGADGNHLDVRVGACRMAGVTAYPAPGRRDVDLLLRLVLEMGEAPPARPGHCAIQVTVVCPPTAAPEAHFLADRLRARPVLPPTEVAAPIDQARRPNHRPHSTALPRLSHRRIPDGDGWLSFRPLASSTDVLAPCPDDR